MSTGTVLVIDDQETNREVLRDLLEADGFHVWVAEDGPSGLEQARLRDPDVVLLDVMMPGMSGYEVCSRLKEDLQTQAVPVLMVTALVDLESRLQGRRAGADDFVTKPIGITETLLRVRNAARSYQRLRKLQELEAFKESIIRMVVHDLKTPVATMVLLAKTLRAMNLDEDSRDRALRQIVGAGQRTLDMVGSLLDLHCATAGVFQVKAGVNDLHELLRDSLESVRLIADHVAFELQADSESQWVHCDLDLVRRVISNLLDNALHVVPNPGGRIVIEVFSTSREVRVLVRDNGPGLDSSAQTRIFEPFFQMNSQNVPLSVGLGLASCKMAIEAHGGRIGVDSVFGQGATFWFTLIRPEESPPSKRAV